MKIILVHLVSVIVAMLAMLTLAKDRIADSMQHGLIRGRTLCTVAAVLIAISMAGLTFLFIRQFVDHFENPRTPAALTQPAGAGT